MRPIDWGKVESTLNGTSVVREQARALAANPGATLVVSVVAAVIVGGALLISAVPLWANVLWFASVVLVSLDDYRTNAGYSEDMDADGCRAQLKRNIVNAAAVGFTWGNLGWILFFEPGASYAILIIMVLIGVAGAAATLSGGHARIAMATVVPALAPLAIHYATLGTVVGGAMAVAIAAYALLLYKAVQSGERALRESVGLHEQTRALAEQLRIVADYSNAWEIWLSDDDRLLWVNPAVEQITGYTPEECFRMEGFPIALIHPDDQGPLLATIERSKASGNEGRCETRIVRKDGTIRWTEGIWRDARDSTGNAVGVRITIRDITENVELREELERQATTDPLTGLINRRRFLEVCEGEIYRGARFGRPVALAMFDLDYFKRVNDTHGHAVGDLCLRAFVGAVRANIRQTDILARFGGEEFTLLMPETDLDEATALCDRLREAVARAAVTTTRAKVGFTVSVGVTVCDPHETSIDPALARADTALYTAKNKGRDQVREAPAPRIAYGDPAQAGGPATRRRRRRAVDADVDAA
jgi:diguanylate cyclase (GGDEF)-like protein/PAS domain S-box-containing protein